MKRFIFIAGMGFYAITFAVIFWITFLNLENSRPDNARVTNVNTRAVVTMPTFATFDLIADTKNQAIVNPAHVDGLSGGALDAMKAYGKYYESMYTDGNVVNYPSVTRGDDWYTEAVCWHCHSQFVRPFAYENYRWGPTSQIGEGAHENPTRYGTRRIGPDLQREGDAHSDDWHLAHFNHPRYTVPQSIMAPYGNVGRYWYQKSRDELDAAQVEIDKWSAGTLKAAEEAAKSNEERWATGFNQVADLMLGDYNDYWIMWKGRIAADNAGEPILRVAEKPKMRVRDLIAYVQTRGVGVGITAETDARLEGGVSADNSAWQQYIRKLEFNAGRWRMQAPMGRPTGMPSHVMAPAQVLEMKKSILEGGVNDADKLQSVARKELWDQSIIRGGNLFLKKCSGCHGGANMDGSLMELDLNPSSKTLALIGNGYGPAAAWLSPEPRNFHLATKPLHPLDENGQPKMDEFQLPRERGSNATYFKNRSGNPDGWATALKHNGLARPEDLYHTIRNGMAPSAMPAWPFLTDWEVWDIVNFVMYLGDNTEGQRVNFEYADGSTEEEKKANALNETASYWSLSAIRQSWDIRPTMPVLMAKPSNNSILSKADNGKNLTGKDKEDYAAAYWAGVLGFELNGEVWSQNELVAIGKAIFERSSTATSLSTGDGLPDCMSCHGIDGDGWANRRGELFSLVGYPARNYYQGQFKLGATREDIWRAMRYGIAGTPMNPQVLEHWSSLEGLAIAEFVLSKRDQGVYGIK